MSDAREKTDEQISMENIAKSALESIPPRKMLQGEIVTIDNDFVYVNVGTKSDGRVSLEEFKNRPAVGDVIDIMLQNSRMVDGMYIFSHEAALREKGWQTFVDLVKSGAQHVSGTVLSSSNKGVIVDVEGIQAFLPFSHAGDVKVKNNASAGLTFTFKIKSVDEKKKSLLLSRKEYLDEQKEKFWNNLAASFKPGDRITGKVTKFVDFGVFVDIGGVEGLLHKNDITWKRVFKKKNIIKVGEEREFVILDINRPEGKISLGLKQLVDDPWTHIDEKYHVGDRVNGRVVTIVNQGVFMEIEDGIEGFLGAHDVSWTKKMISTKDTFAKGQVIEVMVTSVDSRERKLALGLKQILPNPWDSIEQRFPAGTVLKRQVKKVVSFGMFVGIDDDIDGLVHQSDISWEDSSRDPAHSYKAGDEVEFKILEIRRDEMKISCGIKQLTRSPWEAIKEKYPPRSRVSGIISGVVQFGVFVKLEGDVEGLVHVSEVSRRKIENLEDKFKTGDQVSAVVLGVDVDRKRLSLSIKQLEAAEEKEVLSKILNNAGSSRVTIGDLIKMKQGE
ncbi:MAG: S1 RNA-binding domain-containing protein [Spirochaetes bacterium]|nr:MAG: S1 RNA-binding domain-containing protein [Spirochaetota bacterium]